MIIFFVRALILPAALLGLLSCVETTGVDYEKAILKTEGFLEAQPKDHLFSLKQKKTNESATFQFIEGPFNKAALLFPLRITAKISSVNKDQDSTLSVKAYKEGLLFKRNRGKTAEKWRDLILKSL